MMAPTKEQDEADCGGRPHRWHADADQQSGRARGFKDAKHGYPRFRHACLGHVDENLLIANEIERGREDVRRSSQGSNNDEAMNMASSNNYFAIPTIL